MQDQNRFARRAPFMLGLSFLLLGGCGAATEKGLVPVSGKVTLDGGSWPKTGKINFLPTDRSGSSEVNVRPASADFDTSGNFTVSSYEGANGLYPGEYWVSLECWDVEPGMANPNAKGADPKKGMAALAGKSHVPEKYRNSETSGFTLRIEPGQSSASPKFDVKSK